MGCISLIPPGGTYILSGCVNARFWNSSEESLWRQEASAAAGGGGGGGGVSTTRGSETRQHREEVDVSKEMINHFNSRSSMHTKKNVQLLITSQSSSPPEIVCSKLVTY